MRILIVSQYFHPENFRVNDLAIWLVNRGHEVTVLTGIPNYPSGRFFSGYGLYKRRHETWQGVEIIRVPLVPRGKGGGLRLAVNYISFAFIASLLGMLRLRKDYDVIFVHEPSPITVGIPAIVMSKRMQAPILFWVLDLWPESVTATGVVRAPWALGMLTRLTRWIYGHCEKVLVASRAFIPRVKAMGVADDRIAYFPNWAEEVFIPNTAAESPAILPSGFRVMFAGNIGVAQDFPAILDAAERLKGYSDIQWIVLGDGRMAGWVREEVARREIGATVHLIGSYPPELMPRFFAHADAMLVSLKPDPVFSLTVPAKLQAYMACGRPIIAMLDGEGARIVTEAGAGVTCPAGDGQALAEAVLSMSRLPSKTRAVMSRQAHAYSIANFEREGIFCRLEEWMSQAAAAGQE